MENNEKLSACTDAGECRACGEENSSDKGGADETVASEREILERLSRILRREETEDSVVKLREETRTTEEDGKTFVDRSERVEIVKVRPKLSDALRAGELLGKHYGMFGEKLEGSIALPLIICGEDELK
ncbi:MAG: terminase small subunit [Clostridia bacterium]|nr:terminase small subunit [Clostridia bacterium]